MEWYTGKWFGVCACSLTCFSCVCGVDAKKYSWFVFPCYVSPAVLRQCRQHQTTEPGARVHCGWIAMKTPTRGRSAYLHHFLLSDRNSLSSLHASSQWPRRNVSRSSFPLDRRAPNCCMGVAPFVLVHTAHAAHTAHTAHTEQKDDALLICAYIGIVHTAFTERWSSSCLLYTSDAADE